jgi:hypothetical protein
MDLPIPAYFSGARISPFVLVLVIEQTSRHNHEEYSRHNTDGYILATSLHVNPYYYPSESCLLAKILFVFSAFFAVRIMRMNAP